MKNITTILFLFSLVFLFTITCSDSTDNDKSEACETCEGIERTFSDVAEDVSEGFVDMTDLSVTIGSDCIGASMTLANLPQTLTFDPVELSDNRSNYSWIVDFDMDNNGSYSTGDVQLAIFNFKFPGELERESNILAATQENLWIFVSDTNAQKVADINVSIVDNTFLFCVPKSVSGLLSGITESTAVKFSAQHLPDDSTYYYDSYDSSSVSVKRKVISTVNNDGTVMQFAE